MRRKGICVGVRLFGQLLDHVQNCFDGAFRVGRHAGNASLPQPKPRRKLATMSFRLADIHCDHAVVDSFFTDRRQVVIAGSTFSVRDPDFACFAATVDCWFRLRRSYKMFRDVAAVIVQVEPGRWAILGDPELSRARLPVTLRYACELNWCCADVKWGLALTQNLVAFVWTNVGGRPLVDTFLVADGAPSVPQWKSSTLSFMIEDDRVADEHALGVHANTKWSMFGVLNTDTGRPVEALVMISAIALEDYVELLAVVRIGGVAAIAG